MLECLNANRIGTQNVDIMLYLAVKQKELCLCLQGGGGLAPHTGLGRDGRQGALLIRTTGGAFRGGMGA